MMKVLVTGANGQLGKEIHKISKTKDEITFSFTDVDTLDITEYKDIASYIDNNKVDVIINCAAYTNVDKAEDEKEQAYKANTTACKNLASISKQHNIFLIHISTDYVFNGSSNIPYTEDDTTNPSTIYGETKLNGEKEIIAQDIPAYIFRTSWLYSSYGHNFAKTIYNLSKERDTLRVVFDQTGTPTWAHDLAESIVKIISSKDFSKQTEIYNYSNEGVASWYDFAYHIIKKTNTNCSVIPVLSEEYPTKAKRPAYSVLNKRKFKERFHQLIPHWTNSLDNCLKELYE
ncbi:MAG: dTDP-4-dehydrorhamnose reductase [Hyphomicrobiales bacterium]